MIIKHFMKKHHPCMWSYLSVITFLFELTVRLSVFMHAIQKLATKKILVKGYRSVNTCYYA